MKRSALILFGPISLSSLLLTGCVVGENQEFFDNLLSSQAAAGSPTSGPAVCNPFGSSSSGTAQNSGLFGKLFYYNLADETKYPAQKVADIYHHGEESSANFYFDDLYVPTRDFSEGFQLTDGTLLKNDGDTTLLEWFAFNFTTSIQLPKGSGTKTKQFALMSDDGSNLLVQDPVTQAWTTAINNDGAHASKMGCGMTPVTVSSDYPTPMQIQYFQGPRYSIALVLLWRDWDGPSFNPNDPACNLPSGDIEFFNGSVVPSTPEPAWLDVLTRWQVVPANVFYLPSGQANPCN